MKDHPILFSAPMVRALLDGSKTQTRRALKTQPAKNHPHDGGTKWVYNLQNNGLHVPVGSVGHLSLKEKTGLSCPYGQPGDRLWVREAWSTHSFMDGVKPSELKTLSFHYWADGEITTGKRRPSIHMPRFASRITLEIVRVRVERLNEISEADAKSEGIKENEHPMISFLCDFKDLWSQINGNKSWDENPWVWVVEFKRIEQ